MSQSWVPWDGDTRRVHRPLRVTAPGPLDALPAALPSAHLPPAEPERQLVLHHEPQAREFGEERGACGMVTSPMCPQPPPVPPEPQPRDPAAGSRPTGKPDPQMQIPPGLGTMKRAAGIQSATRGALLPLQARGYFGFLPNVSLQGKCNSRGRSGLSICSKSNAL